MPAGNEIGEDTWRTVVDHFPAHALQIRQLCESDESFREMCEDLADAVRTLRGVARLSEAVQALRRAEYEALVQELSREVERTLRRIEVTRLIRASGP